MLYLTLRFIAPHQAQKTVHLPIIYCFSPIYNEYNFKTAIFYEMVSQRAKKIENAVIS